MSTSSNSVSQENVFELNYFVTANTFWSKCNVPQIPFFYQHKLIIKSQNVDTERLNKMLTDNVFQLFFCSCSIKIAATKLWFNFFTVMFKYSQRLVKVKKRSWSFVQYRKNHSLDVFTVLAVDWNHGLPLNLTKVLLLPNPNHLQDSGLWCQSPVCCMPLCGTKM